MQNIFNSRKAYPVLVAVAVALTLVFAAAIAAFAPSTAYAAETSKCTARPNGDSGSDVLGGTETRITWEVDTAADEEVTGLSLKLPEGTSFTAEGARVTMLTGQDFMDRNNISSKVEQSGNTLTVTLGEPALPGSRLRVEAYQVFFPATGGTMQLSGTYTLSDGSTHDAHVPSIEVVEVTLTEQLSSWLESQEWVQAWNSNTFLKLFLNPPILVSSFPVVLKGFFMALGIVAVAFPVAIPFGLLLALMRMSKFRVLRGIATTYVNVVRGTPLFLQIYIAFFGLPLAGVSIPSFPLGVIVLAMNSSAYLCEIFRAGIQSINKGQFEAARSLGMNGAQTMLFVIIPQTVRRVIPTMTSEFILLYKDTSMLAAVGVLEVVMYAKTIVASTGSITPYIVAACFYLVITLPLAKVVGKLEAHLAGNATGGKKKRKKKGTPELGAASPQGPAASRGGETEGTGITPEQMSSL